MADEANRADGESAVHDKHRGAQEPLVLIVDDDIVMLRTMVNILKDNFRTRIAKSAASALQVIAQEKPDLVLLDYMMPVVDGVQALRMMRAEPTMADIPVFFLTGVADSNLVETAVSMKIEGYLLKTTKPEEILYRIKLWFIKHGR